jgi:hypothetical protein
VRQRRSWGVAFGSGTLGLAQRPFVLPPNTMIDELDELHVAAKLELAEIQSRIDAIQLEIDDHLVKVRILQSKKLREFENQRQVASRITLARRLPEV